MINTPGLSPQASGRSVLRKNSTQSIKDKPQAGGHKDHSTLNPLQEQTFLHFVHYHQKTGENIGMHYGEKRIEHIDFAACVW